MSPNQALQTTPMTRSVYEKTIEFGCPSGVSELHRWAGKASIQSMRCRDDL